MNPARRLCVVGPTASGKSAVALALAERLHGEIISVDSMQVYRGLDIGTAKPTTEERARVPHHVIDVVNLSESFSAADFVAAAMAAERQILSRSRTPIFCGGTGFYFKALLHGLGEAPPADPTLRAELEAVPLPDLCRELEQRDPVTFARIDRQNPRRVVRAIEVIRLTGRPFSEQRAEWKGEENRTPAVVMGLRRDGEDLNRRIEARVDEMFARGLVEETASLLRQGLAANPTAMQALGYRQVVEHLRGERSLPETIALVKTRTRQFAKRQMTWFRRQLAVEWIHVATDASVDAIAGEFLKRWGD
jgi:tRNA dimethylallyltransferase